MAEEHVLSFDEALAMLPAGKKIHTTRQAGFMLLGADWDRDTLIEAMRTHRIERTGPSATNMGHGIALFDDQGPLFIETGPPK